MTYLKLSYEYTKQHHYLPSELCDYEPSSYPILRRSKSQSRSHNVIILKW